MLPIIIFFINIFLYKIRNEFDIHKKADLIIKLSDSECCF